MSTAINAIKAKQEKGLSLWGSGWPGQRASGGPLIRDFDPRAKEEAALERARPAGMSLNEGAWHRWGQTGDPERHPEGPTDLREAWALRPRERQGPRAGGGHPVRDSVSRCRCCRAPRIRSGTGPGMQRAGWVAVSRAARQSRRAGPTGRRADPLRTVWGAGRGGPRDLGAPQPAWACSMHARASTGPTALQTVPLPQLGLRCQMLRSPPPFPRACPQGAPLLHALV